MRGQAILGARLYGILLKSYPMEFRQAYGDAMVSVFEESLAEARARSGRYGVLSLWLYTLADLAKTVLAERASGFVAACGIERKTSLGASFAIHGVVLSGIIWVGLHTAHPIHNSCKEHKITHAPPVREPLGVLPRPRGTEVEKNGNRHALSGISKSPQADFYCTSS